jgi:hypothetical protein
MKIAFRWNKESDNKKHKAGKRISYIVQRALEAYPFCKLNNQSATIELPTIKVIPCIISIPGITELLQCNSEKGGLIYVKKVKSYLVDKNNS